MAERNTEKLYKCKVCTSKYINVKTLKLHELFVHNLKSYKCEYCEKSFYSPSNCVRHIKSIHRKKDNYSREADNNDVVAKRRKIQTTISDDTTNSSGPSTVKYLCKDCNTSFSTLNNLERHHKLKRCKEHCNNKNKYDTRSNSSGAIASRSKKKDSQSPKKATQNKKEKRRFEEEVKQVETSFKNRLITFRIENKYKIHDPLQYLHVNQKRILNLIEHQIGINKCIKVNFEFKCTHTNIAGEFQERQFKTKNYPLYEESNIKAFIKRSFSRLNKEMTELAAKKSGWSVHNVNYIEIRVNKFEPLAGCGYIQLPQKIESTRSVINVKNNDNFCFKNAMNSKHLYGKHAERASVYKKFGDKYDFSTISFPTQIKDISKFEKKNNISVNVFGIDDSEKIYPIKVVDNELADHTDLLFLKNNDGNSHYCYIKNFERLVGSQINNHEHKLLICKKCLQCYRGDNDGIIKFKQHKKLCQEHKTTRIDMPEDGANKLKFTNVEYKTELPITVCADFESTLCPVSGCENNPSASNNEEKQTHKLMSYCFFIKHNLPDNLAVKLPNAPVLYRAKSDSDDVAAHFIEAIRKLALSVSDIYSTNELMIELTDDEKISHAHAQICYLCKKKFSVRNHKTRDHDHLTGYYRGASCNLCNLRNRKQMVLPIFFHNLSNYDAHFLIRKLGCVEGAIDVIPNNEEKYISFTKRIYNISCRFLDSYRFLPESLANLAKNLPIDSFIETQRYFPNKHLDLVRKKCSFPYEYVDSLEKLEKRKLPHINSFYSSLNECGISEKEYEHAKKVWNAFSIKDLGEYSDLYLRIDCLLLTDIFYNFRMLCMKYYKLDPAHYFTTPGLTWDAMLKITCIEFELITEYDSLLTIENGIRGGLTQCSTRYASANNPYLPSYNSLEETNYIMYKDANNLYAAAMNEPLPYGGFEVVEDHSSIGPIEFLDDEAEFGYILCVDMVYPKHLHNLHSCLPFLPEKSAPPGSNCKKLLATLNDKFEYVLHYRALKQALKHGLKLKKIHKIIRFKQSRWMKSYIDLNTELRKCAQNDFETEFFKLMNNAVFGKCMEQIRNRLNMKLICSEEQLQKVINKPTFVDRTIYGESLAAVHLEKENILMNKPTFVGQAVLDLSKVIMYEFFYSVLKPKYGERLTLLYMDTDSFIFEVKCKDFYKDMKKMAFYFDTSNYPIDHPCFSTENKKVLAKFKDEMAGIPISEFVGLRAKVYAIKIQNTVIKKLKGIKKYALQSKIHFHDYIKCLRDTKVVLRTSYYNIISRGHRLTTNKFTKVALSAFDDKRYIRTDGVRTLPWGHYRIHRLEDDRIPKQI